MKIYLLVNAVLYAVFAIWCTLAPERTAVSLGYVARSASGQSEYLVIYGGLQAGLAVFFWWCTRDAQHLHPGVMLAVALYAPIVLYRLATVWKLWPVSPNTLVVGALEVALLAWGLAVLGARR
jgi:hypothetical protein